MKWLVAKSELSGSINIPPSKSHTIRALLVATLAKGQSRIHNPLLKGDGRSAINAAKGLGADITEEGATLIVSGIGGDFSKGMDTIDCGNSGTSTNLFASAAALGARPRTFDGDTSLRSRPVRTLLDALAMLGASYTIQGQIDLPFIIKGPIKGGRATVRGISSQYVSSLLFSTPLAPNDTSITVLDLHERPYVELTLWWLDRMKIAYTANAELTQFSVKGNQVYQPIDLSVPADFSSATFSAVAGALGAKPVLLKGLDFSDPQGDKGVFTILQRCGAVIDHTPQGVMVFAPNGLEGQTIDLNAMPDALPALAVLGCAARGETRLVNVAQARIKETDRIRVMASELKKMGADIQENPDGLLIRQSTLHGAAVDGHDDHRVVMALALAGFIARGETTISTAEAAEVTYPSFAADFKELGASLWEY